MNYLKNLILLICLILTACSSSDNTNVNPSSSTEVPYSTPALGYARELDKSTWQISPMNAEPDLNFGLEIKLLESKWLELNGQVALQVKVQITNLGPTATSKGLLNFDVIDKDRALGRFEFSFDVPGCEWQDVTLLKGGSIEQCLTFTGNFTSDVELVYSPYKERRLDEGRYIRFPIAR